MPEQTKTADGEPVLWQGTGLSMRGLLAHAGEIVVTSRRLAFTPRRLDALAGARPWVIELRHVSRAARRGMDDVLEVHHAGGEARLMGESARHVEAAVHAALEDMARLPADTVPPAPGETVLFSSEARLLRARQPVRRGRVVLVNSRLAFAFSGVDKLLEPQPVIALPSSDLDDAQLVEGVVAVAAAGTGWRIETDGAHRLFVALCGVRHVDVPASGRFRCFGATLEDAAVPQPGVLSLQRDRLRFLPDGAAAPSVDVPLAQLLTLDRPRGAPGRLAVTAGDGKWTFSLAQADQRWEELLRLLAEAGAPADPPRTDEGEFNADGVTALLQPWRARLPGLTPAGVASAGPAVKVTPSGNARRGWVLLFQQALVFLPAGPVPEKDPLDATTLDALAVLDEDLRQPAVLAIGKEKEPTRFFLPGAEGFANRFRGHVRRLLQARRSFVDESRSRNRRRSYRAPPPDPVTLRLGPRAAQEPPTVFMDARLVDISLDGCRVALETPIKGVSAVEVEIPTEPPLKLSADVVSVAKPTVLVTTWSYGLHFRKPAPAEEGRIRELWMTYQREEARKRGA